MDHFHYHDHKLHAEDVSLAQIAQEVGTPFYCYSTATLTRHVKVFTDAFEGTPFKLCYATKANSNVQVLRTLKAAGAGADVVSEGEIRLARAAGIEAQNIVFSGVGKTKAEMAYALSEGIFQFNVESEPELRALQEVASSLNTSAPIAIRVNPDVEAGTHAKISTGQKESKFGIALSRAMEVYDLAASLPNIKVQGISVHIGSQLTSLAPFDAAFAAVSEFVGELRAKGHDISVVDFGGGLGIPYTDDAHPPSPADYAAVVAKHAKPLDCLVVLEPGRLIVGNAGVLVSQVEYVKVEEGRHYAILDAAMNDLIRPTLYDAFHSVVTVKQAEPDGPMQTYDVVGPICETGDTFAKNRFLPKLAAGDLVVFRSAGAYGATMNSTYNARRLPAEVLVDGDQWRVIRPRQSYDDLLKAYGA